MWILFWHGSVSETLISMGVRPQEQNCMCSVEGLVQRASKTSLCSKVTLTPCGMATPHVRVVFLPNTTFFGRFTYLEIAVYLSLPMCPQTQIVLMGTQIRHQLGKCRLKVFRKQSSKGLNSRNLPGWHLKVGGGVQETTNKSKSPHNLKQEPNLKTFEPQA